jgi:transcription elongation factor GreB
MSRAFVKENDEQGNELPERPQSPYPNHITPAGLEALHHQLAGMEEAHKRMVEPVGNELIDQDAKHALERDIRYVQDRIARAIVIDPSSQPKDRVAFGATVEPRTRKAPAASSRSWARTRPTLRSASCRGSRRWPGL